MKTFLMILSIILSVLPGTAECLYLRDNLKLAQKGDFIVTQQGSCHSLLLIYDVQGSTIAIEEIIIPSNKVPKSEFSWREWMLGGALESTSRVVYHIDLDNAVVDGRFALTRSGWRETAMKDNFLSTLLNLQLYPIPQQQRRRVGLGVASATDRRPLWQPNVIVDGQTVDNVVLDAWQTFWPKDGTELSGRQIEAYLPAEGSGFPSYFPYWLQVNGTLAHAKIRIVDSGRGLILK